MTLTEIRTALDSRGLRPLKQLGQNFLHDQNLAKWLADRASAGLHEGATLVEIGPRTRRADRIPPREKPPRHCPGKGPRPSAFSCAKNSPPRSHRENSSCARAMRSICSRSSASLPPSSAANLPYYISTPLLMECLRLPGPPARLFFLVQKEVGQRLAAAPGNKVYGSVSVIVQAGYQVAVARTLPGSVFYPPPEVESVAVELTPLARPPRSIGRTRKLHDHRAAWIFPAPQKALKPARDPRRPPRRGAFAGRVGRALAENHRGAGRPAIR